LLASAAGKRALESAVGDVDGDPLLYIGVVATLTLEIVEGANAGEQFHVVELVELGREATGVRLDDPLASRHHARVGLDEAHELYIEDLESSNGTFVNGNEVYARTRLEPGDHVLIGTTVIEVRSAEQVARQPTAVRPIPPGLAQAPQRPTFIPPEVAKAPPEPPTLDPLLDVNVKHRTRTAPLGLFVIASLAVAIFFATR